MHRALTVIAAAILLTQPTMSETTARAYAKVVQAEAVEHYFDPFTMVAMVHYESRWRSNVTNGQCVGLGQICLTNYSYCRSNPKGVQCLSKKIDLLDGATNLRTAADSITANRRFCRKKTGRAKFHHWLASYGGFNKPKAGVWCGQKKVRGRWRDVPVHHLTDRVMKRRRTLMRRLTRGR
jgi:hypothetical protein